MAKNYIMGQLYMKFSFHIICLHFFLLLLFTDEKNKFLILGNKNANHRQNIWF